MQSTAAVAVVVALAKVAAVRRYVLNIKREVLKPWGKEIIWAETKDYVGKILFINKGHRLSRQYHSIKEETIIVNNGRLTIEIGAKQYFKKIVLSKGECYHVKPNTVHRFCAPDDDVEIFEVSTPHLEDVVRLEDDYRR
jgi:mannose-6-phosphate isomerase-like protein (cupin superfamily)